MSDGGSGWQLAQINIGKMLAPKGDPLAVAVYRGQTCHVPRDDGSDSAQVFQYLSLLVTLSKIPGAIPASPAMLVR